MEDRSEAVIVVRVAITGDIQDFFTLGISPVCILETGKHYFIFYIQQPEDRIRYIWTVNTPHKWVLRKEPNLYTAMQKRILIGSFIHTKEKTPITVYNEITKVSTELIIRRIVTKLVTVKTKHDLLLRFK